MPINNRIFFAVEQLLIAPDGTLPAAYSSAHVAYGLQSIGINTKFNLDPIFEIGQLAVYELVETLPDVEMTASKVFDGRAFLWHLATPTATSGTLVGRSAIKCQGLMSLFPDTNNSASGAPNAEVEMSGLFVSSLQYEFPIQGPFTESVTFVGNNKQWRTAGFGGSGLFTGNNNAPAAASGVLQRQDFTFGSGTGCTVLPPSIPGISGVGSTGSGYHLIASGNGPHIQSIRVSANLGRENLLELGRRGPYFRFVNFPVEVTCEIEAYCLSGDRVNALETSANNVVDECIRLKTNDFTVVDLGNKNRLQSVSYGGANAGRQGGNATMTFSYTNFNSDLILTNPTSDPAAIATPA